MLNKVKLALLISSNDFDSELTDLIGAAVIDLNIAGVDDDTVVSDDPTDKLIIRAIISYCSYHFELMHGTLAEKISLITTTYTQDDIGEWVEAQTKTEVFAVVSSITMAEFYQAGMQGLKPDYRFTIWLTEYDNQDLVEYKGKIYSVYRSYRRDDGRIELYVNEKKGEEDDT